jgi:hypothetical protein
MPYAPHPALFAEAVKGELYDHRRAIEDYSKSTQLPRAEGQQSLGLTFGPRHPLQTGEVKITLHVRLNDTGRVLFDARDMRIVVDGCGYKIKPAVEGMPVVRDRLAKDAPAPVVPEAPAASVSLLV